MSVGNSDPAEVFGKHWLEKAEDDLATARSDLDAQRFGNAVRSLYFACFHALRALLWKEGIWSSTMRRPRSIHKSVRSILHRDLIKTGRLDALWGERCRSFGTTSPMGCESWTNVDFHARSICWNPIGSAVSSSRRDTSH